MLIYNTDQIRAWDAYTITHEPISSIKLMERACSVFFDWFLTVYPPEPERAVVIFAGTGNNGGDGVTLARRCSLLYESVELVILQYTDKNSPDFEAQLHALSSYSTVRQHRLMVADPLPKVPPQAIIMDALMGSGLSRPLTGAWEKAVHYLNELPNDIVAVDVPSGLFCDKATVGPCVKATRTFSFECPKLSFFFPENAENVGKWTVGSIGLHPDFETTTTTPFNYLDKKAIWSFIRLRAKYAHKGTFGHALILAGSYGKTGAAILAARAALRSGVGLLTVHAPRCSMPPLQTAVPEAMFEADSHENAWNEVPKDLQRYTAIGVGCGIGTAPDTASALANLLDQARKPIVLDADALNLLAQHPEWWPMVPPDSILTPHLKEFERLFGVSGNDFDRNNLQRRMATEKKVIIVLKGAHTAIALPDDNCWFNSTGNPGMATGGSGDVLTGILTGLLAQGYAPRSAALLGVFLHGLAGDLAAAQYSQPGMIAGDITAHIGEAWITIIEGGRLFNDH